MESVYDLFTRGTRLLEDGDFHAATVPLARARDLAPDKTSIREALGRALFRSQRYEQAAAEFEAVVERAPPPPPPPHHPPPPGRANFPHKRKNPRRKGA